MTYLPVADVTQEAFAAALAAAAAAAAKRLSKLKPPSGPPPVPVHVRDAPGRGDALFDALLVTALVALAIFLLPEELAAAAVAAIGRAILESLPQRM